MEERSNVLFGRPNEVETLLFLPRKTQFCYERQDTVLLWKAFLEQFNISVAVPEGEEELFKKAVLFFYNLGVLQAVHWIFLFHFDSNNES